MPGPAGEPARNAAPEATGPGWASQVFALNPAGVSWLRGMLLLDLMLVPLLVFWAIGHEQYLFSAIFGVLFVGLVDPGGSIRSSVPRSGIYALIGAAVTALAFGLGDAGWEWLAFASFAVTLVAGLAGAFGAHRFVAALLLNVWFIVAIAIAVPLSGQTHISGSTWTQVLAWVGGAALWIAGTVVAWLVRGRTDRAQLVAELPGDTSRQKLTGPVIVFAVIRALVIGGTVAIAFGQNLQHGSWMPIAAIVAMKPSVEQTTVVGLQRLSGALIGAIAAALLMLIPANEHGLRLLVVTNGLSAVALVLLAHGFAVRFWNYAFYCAAIAAGVLVLLDRGSPSHHSAGGYRVLWTLCGVGIAVVVMLLAELLAKRGHAKQPTPAAQPG